MKQSPVVHPVFSTHVPSLPGETSQLAPNFVHAVVGGLASFFVSAGGHPMTKRRATLRAVVEIVRETMGDSTLRGAQGKSSAEGC